MPTEYTLKHSAVEIDTKLDNALLKTSQELTEEERAQVKLNLGISGSDSGSPATPEEIGAAPENHASTATTYGVASATNYGHVKATSTSPKPLAENSSLGTETSTFARGDHVHKVPDLNDCGGSLSFEKGGLGLLSTPTPGALLMYWPLSADEVGVSYVSSANGAFYSQSSDNVVQCGTLPVAQGGTGTTSASGILKTLGINPEFLQGSVTNIVNENTTYMDIRAGIFSSDEGYVAPESNHLYAGVFYTNLLEQRPFIVFAQAMSSNSNGILVNIGPYDISFGRSSCTVHTAGTSGTLTSLDATIILCKII